MNKEQKICQNCHQEFWIEPEDFNFYEKMKVPAPTWCSVCRLQRKLLTRNERTLYKRLCELCKKNVISMYSPEAWVNVYCQDCWWSDKWDALNYGKDYDFSRPFFEQFKNLAEKTPRASLNNVNAVNSEYCNQTFETKNCYLNFASDINEDSGYLYHTVQSKNSFDLIGCKNQNLCYENFYSHDNYACLYSYFSNNCLNSAFLFNCQNCQNCFGCVNLRNVHYYIFNKPLIKEEYEEEIKKYDTGDFKKLETIKEEFWKSVLNFPHRYVENFRTVNSTGDYLSNAKNCKNCFDIEGPIENSKNIVYGIPNIKDSLDIYGTGAGIELCYEIVGCGLNLNDVAFSLMWEGYSNRYVYFCRGVNNCFGCFGLRNKQYCILNKQYTKEEYEVLVPKIIEHMNTMPYLDKKKRIYTYGEFFPPEHSSFAYNETIAQEYFPLTKEEAERCGFFWRDLDIKDNKATKHSNNLPNHIKEVEDSIISEIISCAHEGNCTHQCTKAFKIIPSELSFYRRMNLPLPRLCPNCRHYERLARRNPIKLWHRACMCEKPGHNHAGKCANEFETSYAPERPEIVYCEECYQKEVL